MILFRFVYSSNLISDTARSFECMLALLFKYLLLKNVCIVYLIYHYFETAIIEQAKKLSKQEILSNDPQSDLRFRSEPFDFSKKSSLV